MKNIILLTALINGLGFLLFSSCKKEKTCENCLLVNKPPIANAGKDTLIIFPTDSMMLDGSKSTDTDDGIVSFKWEKISGSDSFNIKSPSSMNTVVNKLVKSVYQFKLSVIDKSGQKSWDTLKITVSNGENLNRPPIANAGNDTTIFLPASKAFLDASKSYDPDNNIKNYMWTNISGPSIVDITNPTAIKLEISDLTQGIYLIELKVMDSEGLFSKDTVKVYVDFCGNRPVINAKLVPIGLLSMEREGLVSASAGNKILFAGGRTEYGYSRRVDIYDIVTNAWSTAELSIGERDGMVAASVGNKILFAGGINSDVGIVTSRVDIYDASTNTWSTAELSKARGYLSAATLGNKVFFAGGGSGEPFFVGSNVVDIYDNTTNTWTKATLSEGRSFLSATTAGNKIYFAGGSLGVGIQNVSTKIDMYDGATNSWSTSNLHEGRSFMASVAVDDKIFWGGGINAAWSSGQSASNQVEIMNINTGVSSYACMIPRYDFRAVIKRDNIIFFTGFASNIDTLTNLFEIYNITTDTWTTGALNLKLNSAAIISVNNTIYVAGGRSNQAASNQVWKLEF